MRDSGDNGNGDNDSIGGFVRWLGTTVTPTATALRQSRDTLLIEQCVSIHYLVGRRVATIVIAVVAVVVVVAVWWWQW